jgi:protein tyrosine phosphatase (PTP) superfamily phosphohydrolase (DUF442 family)
MNNNLSQLSKTVHSRTALRIVLIAILFFSGAIWAWEAAIKNYFVPKRFGVVEAGRVYRSGQISAPLIKKILVEYKIGEIVSLCGDENEPDDNAEKHAAAELGIDRLVIPLSGNGIGDINNYAKAIAAICEAEKMQKPVLVHCSSGTHRVGGVTAAYRLLVEKKNSQFVLDEMKQYGFNPKKNVRLLPYLNSKMKDLAVLLKQKGVIDNIPSPLPQIGPAN